MNTPEFQTLLEQLRRELETADQIDDKGRELLQALDTDIHALLERSEGASLPSTLSRLDEAIAHFEVEHPSLTAALSQMFASLSNAGI
ncbi:MAG: DUF4404 family protein [Anaerolineales bacterium]